jgi:hypothetical protein
MDQSTFKVDPIPCQRKYGAHASARCRGEDREQLDMMELASGYERRHLLSRHALVTRRRLRRYPYLRGAVDKAFVLCPPKSRSEAG